jgi:putative NADPH-quinone reductase
MKIAVINFHPRKGSLSDALALTYGKTAADLGAHVQMITVRDLKFRALLDPTEAKSLEPDLKKSQKIIAWCQHLCVVFPTWWFGVPAVGKAFIDRVLLPGFAFEFVNGFPKGLLSGRSARILHTMGSPTWVNWVMGQPQVKVMKQGTLGFCGFSPVKVTSIGDVKAGKALHEGYLEKARRAAEQDVLLMLDR